ncbi:tubulin binding cofactor c, putative [Plasmodium knowlesi strain H]|uniref:Tubulin binding cofactor c, putative n=3 Tax=Plasmodium knowlesi TaxID=5850 RepID=A0A5K1TVZ5_PLAKH|nr:tubulin binding cofactor c, putative [Plasmodium knowlesi strain H]OTN65826.1 putative Tubulin binding cofactor C [Plasmodium knowlesi]CAA9987801.1 tubulin binding cofactor c, putative [Plasmodium knowlesi strain H]SBO22413.1 tubulin binding cofactor c, putative [Plasmodium knowlesi strain H]SBO29528.1 tubulin binding cofactor c, putative [Plasmodium knowlesi strain H]VVS77275.1 tubulin binding cofactor c, putative [Plasmodium knowlesi strain H]|eukprot:XP_002258798.1 Tubulin binding cofactor C, putative [Plasmodium knowlesi strain H]
MDEDLITDGCDNYEEILHTHVKDIEQQVLRLKSAAPSDDNALAEINQLRDRSIHLKDELSNVYFQFLKHSSVVIYEKKLKELIKEIGSLKHALIQNKNREQFEVLNASFDDSFVLPEDNSPENEDDSRELNEDWIDLNQHKLSFQDIHDERIVRGIGEIQCSSLLLDNLVNCEVVILDVLSSVLIRKIKNCTIWVAAVESSLLIYNCVDCNILTNSKQIRIHDSSETNFYINSVSSPIIENSKQLAFFPYILNYDGLSELLKKINISRDSTQWMKVLDFNWQNTQEKSPNFRVSEEAQMYHITIGKKDLTKSGEEGSTGGLHFVENLPGFLKKVD